MDLIPQLIALILISFGALAAQSVDKILEQRDFANAKQTKQNGQTLVLADLTPSGAEKLRQLKVGENTYVEVKLAGEDFKLKPRAPLDANHLQMGPFSAEEATRIVDTINQQ